MAMNELSPRWSRFGVGVVDLTAGLVLSVLVYLYVAVSPQPTGPAASVWGGIAATLLTLPVVWARRSPLTAAAVVAAGSVLSWVVFDGYVRCGPSLPAAFWIAYVVGRRTRGRSSALGLALVLVDIEAQCLSDPALGAAQIVGFAPIAVAFWFGGRTLTARTSAMHQIAGQNAAIVEARERTAELAVAADRERISSGLDGLLQRRIADMGEQAARARGRDTGTGPALAAIAEDGRQALAEMRDVVSILRGDAPLQPQPSLDGLAELIDGHGGRLEVVGDHRRLPGGMDASAFRIVEQLLLTVKPARVQVSWARDQLELQVAGRPTTAGDGPHLSAVRQRVAVHDGTLSSDTSADELRWTATLPLNTGHA
jgi:signal transduction histidine kinase